MKQLTILAFALLVVFAFASLATAGTPSASPEPNVLAAVTQPALSQDTAPLADPLGSEAHAGDLDASLEIRQVLSGSCFMEYCQCELNCANLPGGSNQSACVAQCDAEFAACVG